MFDSKGRVGTFGPVHPGSILREEFIAPLGLTAGRVAEACGLARTRIEPIVAEDIGISEDTAIRLGRVFRITPQLWMNSQLHYDVARAASAMDSAVNALARITPAKDAQV